MMLLLTVVALRLVGFRRWHAVLARWRATREPFPGRQAEILVEKACATLQRATAVAAHGRHPANCLERSLVLWWLLRRLGIKGDLRIGIHKDTDRFEAHAWVEHGGVALNEGDDVRQHFAVFDRAIVPRGRACR
jgi:hypothetical protein